MYLQVLCIISASLVTYFLLLASGAGAAGGGSGPLTLRNSLLFDVAEAQSNRVRRLSAPRAPVLVFTGAEPSLPLPVNE